MRVDVHDDIAATVHVEFFFPTTPGPPALLVMQLTDESGGGFVNPDERQQTKLAAVFLETLRDAVRELFGVTGVLRASKS